MRMTTAVVNSGVGCVAFRGWAAGAQVVLEFGEGSLYRGGVDAIADLLAVLAGGEEAAAAQQGELLGGVGLADVEALGDGADGQFDAAGEQFEHLLALLAGQALEELAQLLARRLD